MKYLKSLSTLILLLLFTGCASVVSQEEFEACIYGTSTAGAIIGGSVGSVPGAAAGTAGGALVGYFVCGKVGQAPAPAPVEAEQAGFFWPDDQDRDGVRDPNDMCPFTPEGVAVESNGCAVDSDGDGVPDYLDQCPGTPLGTVVDTTGCARTLVTLEGIHFEFDSARLTSEAQSILNRAAPSIKANPSTNISVEGYTDSTGSDAYNLNLSQRRAQSVVDYLVSQGVSASRLQPVGNGESNPVASNDTREGRRLNRRVEVIAK